MRKRIADAMNELWQKNIVCNYVIVADEQEVLLSNTYALDAYMETYIISKSVDVVRCFMAPTGEKAANPVFVVEYGKVFLSGMFIYDINFKKDIKELYSAYIEVVGKERMQVTEHVSIF